MKQKLLKLLNHQIVFLLSLLGFSLASQQCAAQYAAPTALYKLRGIVTSENMAPLKNIRVVIRTDTTKDNYYSKHGDTLYTDSNGVFICTFDLWREQKLFVNFKDIDGEKDGEYLSLDKVFVLKPEDSLQSVQLKEKK